MTNPFFSARSVVKAEELRGPRVYSTDLIPSLFDTRKIDESRTAGARALKIKILTKGLVTINCAHLVTPLGVHLLRTHPDLLEGTAILPAFREDKAALSDYVVEADFARAKIDRTELEEHLAKLNEDIKRVMPWQLGNVGNSLRALLVSGLRNPRALIVRELGSNGKSGEQIEKIAKEIEGLNFDEDKHLNEYLDSLPDDSKKLVKRFATACYHSNGTSVVQCETGTDLSALSGFKAADVVLAARDAGDEQLSEDAIFLEAFMGLALDTIQATIAPAQVIDNMDFKTVHQLSGALREQGFQSKYEEIIESLASSISHPNAQEALDQLDESAIASKAAELAKAFQTEIAAELPDYETALQSAASLSRRYRRGDGCRDGGSQSNSGHRKRRSVCEHHQNWCRGVWRRRRVAISPRSNQGVHRSSEATDRQD